MKRNWLFLVWVVLLAGCGTGGNPPPLLIGHVYDKQTGSSPEQGLRLAVKDVNNNKEKQLGRPVAVLHVGTKGEREVFAGEATRLTTINKVVALIGGQTTAEVAGLEQENVPVLAPTGYRSPTLSPHMFLTGLTPSFKGETLARFAAHRLLADPAPQVTVHFLGTSVVPGPILALPAFWMRSPIPPRVIVLVDERQPEFDQTAKSFSREFPREMKKASTKGSHPTVEVWSYQTDVELVEYAHRLEEENPTAILVVGKPSAIEKIRLRFQAPHVPLLFAGREVASMDFASKRLTNHGIYLVTSWTSDVDTPQNHDFVKRYQETYQQSPDIHAALAYDNANLLFTALKNANQKFSRDEIQKQLEVLKDFSGLTGSYAFNKNHVLQLPAIEVFLRQGQPVLLERYDPKKTE